MSFFVWFTGATEASGTPSAAGTPIGLPVEADSATALGKAKVKAIGLATETDTPSAFGHGSKEIGQPTSAHTALALGRNKTKAIGQASSAHTAIVARPVRAKAIGIASSNQFVIGLRRVRTHKVGQPSTTTSALSMVPALSGGGGALWTPADHTAGMVSWFDAADAAQLVFSGSNLTQWKDKSPAANHAVPFGTGPTLTSINGLGSLAFNAQGLHTTTAVSFTDFTAIAVFKAGAPGSDFGAAERIADHDYANGWWLGREVVVDGQNFGGGVRNVTPPYGRYVSLPHSATHMLYNQRSGTTQTVSRDGGAVVASGACDGAATSTNVVGIAAGYNDAPTDRLNNDTVCELLIYSTALAGDDLAKVEGYLAWKWGIQAELPVGHPYKSAAPTVPVDEDWGPDESVYDPSVLPEFIIDDYYECNFGNKFRVLANGRITGIRHYNSPGAFSSRLVCLWSEAGVLLASGTTAGDVDGWNTFDITPVNVAANEIIWASYGHHGQPDVWSMGFDVPLVSDSPNLEWLLGGQAETGTGHYDDFPLYEDDTTHHFADVVFQESLATGVTIPIGQPTVADTAPPLGRAKTKAIGQPSSAHTATATGKAKVKATGLPTSATTALALIRAKAKAIGQPSTAHTATALGKAKVKAIGLATEPNSSLLLTRAKRKATGQIAEADSALTSRPRRARTIGLPTETDSARSLARRVKVGLAVDTSSTAALSRAKRRALALPLEADTTTALGHPKSKAIGQASSVHTALPPTRTGSTTVSPAVETDSALHPTARRARAIGLPAAAHTALSPLRRVKSKTIGIAVEADTATAPKRTKLKAVGTTAEATSAPPVGRARRRGTATASEADSARSLAHARAKAIGQATEADLASKVIIPGFFRVAHEADSALALSRAKAKAIGQAVEADAAVAIRRGRTVEIGIVTDISIPLAVGYGRSAVIGIAEESDRAAGMLSFAIETPPHRTANAPAASRTAVAGPARSRTADVVARSREATCTARSRTVAATGASRTATPPGRSREITLPATLRAAA